MTIKIQFVSEPDFSSPLIEFFTWSRFSHVDLVLPDGKLLGARINGGVKIREPGYEEFDSLQQWQVECDEYQAERITVAAKSQIGTPYDWLSIVNFVVHRNWRKTNSWFCSELVAWAFEQGGLPLLNPRVEVNRITPEDILLSPLLKQVVAR
jgi:uncharacterized protein YycO